MRAIFTKTRLLGALLGFCFVAAAHAATPTATSLREFKSVCQQAFQKSSGADEEAGSSICACAAQESKHQGISNQALRAETAQIRKDPKYQIHDPHLLDAFHYCTLSAMHEAEGHN